MIYALKLYLPKGWDGMAALDSRRTSSPILSPLNQREGKMKTLAVVLALVFSTWAHAENWDNDQSEIWKVIAQSWVDDVGETGKWPGSYVHDNVVAWDSDWPVPRGKDSLMKWNRFSHANSEVLEYELFPLAIVVEGDTGVAHYSVVLVRKNSEGKNKRSVGGVIETLLRVKGSWKFLSLGGFTIGEDD